MALIDLQNISLNLGGKTLLESVNLSVDAGERVCLVGRNGVGKSSLLGVMSGDIQPDAGLVVYSQGVRFGHMPQAVPEQWSGPVFALVAAGLGAAGEALAAAHLLASGQEAHLPPALRDKAQHFLESGNGWERYGDVLEVIQYLGLKPEALFEDLSGGTRRRVALARALLASTDLLLDEPTNHLDIASITWLEEFLQKKARTLIFISHDRAFVRRLATRIIEVDRGQVYTYPCGYDTFMERREARLEAEAQQSALFDKKLAQEEAWVRQGIKARRTRNMGRVRALQAMRTERHARQEVQGNVTMLAHEAEKSGKLVLEAKDLGFVYPDGYPVFEGFSTIVQRGDRIGLVGANGAGKTTLLRVLLGELEPTHGTLRHGTRLQISYFDQLRQTLDPNVSVMDSVAHGNDMVVIDGQQRHVAGYLQDFLFPSDRLRVPVSTLSGGERNRLLLAHLFTRPSNVLVLDEPTNDLDMETLDLLEELLDNYKGTVLMVSHDRTFLDNLVTSTFAMEGDGHVHEYVGGYTDWVRQRRTGTNNEKNTPSEKEKKTKDVAKKLGFKEQRERILLEEELAALPAQIEKLEKEHLNLSVRLEDPQLFSKQPDVFNAAVARLAELDEAQLTLLARWESVEERLAELAVL